MNLKKALRSRAAVLVVLLFVRIDARGETMKAITLPKPSVKGKVSVEEALRSRRSVRSYAKRDLTLEQVSQLLWAAQGITDDRRGLRAAPSAGALYPLEVYVVKNDGLFHYVPEAHRIEPISEKDVKPELARACWGQGYVEEAAIDIVICAVYERVTGKYGQRGVRYTDMEAGHAAQNVFLQAEALGLASVPIGAFDDNAVARILGLPREVRPLYVLPVGHKK
jgi:SagB-type dehydrogenase family enzyme